MESAPFNVNSLVDVVQTNCHISDAKYAGNYSLCIFLLKMREYYRWEQQIPLTETLDKKALGDWLVSREESWNDYEDREFLSMPIKPNTDPFNSKAINQFLAQKKLVYSAGYGLFQKPHFFLAELIDTRCINGINIFISGKEFARDLVAPPAMTLDHNIFVRREPLRRFVWEKIEEWQWKKDNNSPMAHVLKPFGDQDLESVLDVICDNEVDSLVLHELGEIQAGLLLGDQWNTMVSSLPRSSEELKVRAVRDLLADCLSTLPELMERGKASTLHFYFANFSGMRQELFPEAFDAYKQWTHTSDLDQLQHVVEQGQRRWQSTAIQMLEAYNKDEKHIPHVNDLVCAP